MEWDEIGKPVNKSDYASKPRLASKLWDEMDDIAKSADGRFVIVKMGDGERFKMYDFVLGKSEIFFSKSLAMSISDDWRLE